jgi:hypothetical protein
MSVKTFKGDVSSWDKGAQEPLDAPNLEARRQYDSEADSSPTAPETAATPAVVAPVMFSSSSTFGASLEGIVYHWSSGTLIRDVTISFTDANDSTISLGAETTDIFGSFSGSLAPVDSYSVTASRTVTSADTSRIITSADALAALKLAVRLNPNPDPDGSGPLTAASPSPYQFIAADINGDGRVTSADALEILKIAVRLSTAIAPEWRFVPESDGFWDTTGEFTSAPTLDRTFVTWSSEGITGDTSFNSRVNFVAVLAGDVDGSWTSKDTDVNYIPDNYYELLQDPAPVFTSSPIGLSVDENEAVGSVIYTAQAVDDGANAGALTYALGEGGSDLVQINSDTGEVTLLVAPDYEQETELSFTVRVTDQGGNIAEQQVLVAVNNLDEIAPTITSSATASSIDENSGANQLVYTVTSTDDADISGGVTYSLESLSAAESVTTITSGAVDISMRENEDGTFTLSFFVGESVSVPQGEVLENFDFTLFFDTAAIAPVADGAFTSSLSLVQINADVPGRISVGAITLTGEVYGAGSLLGELTVTPLTSAPLDFTVAEVQLGSMNLSDSPSDFSVAFPVDEFAIDANSGEVVLLGNPNFELRSEYTFKVIATDAAGNSSDQLVTLAVNNLDEVAPIFADAVVDVTIDENSGFGQTVYQAQADDSADISGGVTYSLDRETPVASITELAGGAINLTMTDNGDGTFTLAFYVGDVLPVSAPGTIENFDFVVKFAEGGFDSIVDDDFSSDFAISAVNELDGGGVAIGAIDLNGFALAPGLLLGELIVSPKSRSELNVSIENISLATIEPAQLASPNYNVTLPVSEIEIDSETGVITLNPNPDFEAVSTYAFTVFATDAAGLVGTQDIRLAINNIDEDAPVFVSSDQAETIQENSGANQIVYTAEVDDSADISGGVSFSLSADSDPALTIDSLTGQVTLTDDPDFEAQASYQFTVVAADAASNSSSLAVTLEIENVDDTAFIFTTNGDALAVQENSPSGQIVYTPQVEVVSGSSAYTFSLSADSDTALSIDPNTGDVSLNESPDFEAMPAYSYTVIVSDNLGNAASQSVVLPVINLDDTAPVFTSSTEASAVTGTARLYQAIADDSADVSNGDLVYSLQSSGDAALLSIDSQTGVVTLADGLLDADLKSSYVFTVEASDGINAPATRNVTATVSSAILVQGTGVVAQGAIRVDAVDNLDGTYTLEFRVDESIAGNYSGGIENFDLKVFFDESQFEPIVEADFSTPLAISSVFTGNVGVLTAAALDLNPFDISAGAPIGELIVTPLNPSTLELTVGNVNINEDTSLPETVIQFGDAAIFTGTADSDSFLLLGGDVEVTSGAGNDVFMITDKVAAGQSITLTDFAPGQDTIDFTSVLESLNYSSLSDQVLGPAQSGVAREFDQTSMELLDLLLADDLTFDNSFGFLNDADNGTIIGFYDANSDSNAVDIRTFQINIGGATLDITIDDTTASLGGFIA